MKGGERLSRPSERCEMDTAKDEGDFMSEQVDHISFS
jgi:hypothetical protein